MVWYALYLTTIAKYNAFLEPMSSKETFLSLLSYSSSVQYAVSTEVLHGRLKHGFRSIWKFRMQRFSWWACTIRAAGTRTWSA